MKCFQCSLCGFSLFVEANAPSEKITVVVTCFCFMVLLPKTQRVTVHEKVKQDLVQVRTERVERDLVQVTRTYDSVSSFQAWYCLLYLMRQKLCLGYFALKLNMVEVVI